jgi:hypothetical protein
MIGKLNALSIKFKISHSRLRIIIIIVWYVTSYFSILPKAALSCVFRICRSTWIVAIAPSCVIQGLNFSVINKLYRQYTPIHMMVNTFTEQFFLISFYSGLVHGVYWWHRWHKTITRRRWCTNLKRGTNIEGSWIYCW